MWEPDETCAVGNQLFGRCTAGSGNKPCVKLIDRTSTNRMKDPYIVRAYILSNAELPIVEGIDRHELGWVGTKFRIVCIL